MDFSHFEWVSFDCYGTLVDWETGISSAVARVMAAHEVRRSRAEILALFAESEPKVQTSPGFMEYRRVLRGVMKLIADGTGVELAESDLTCLADSLPDWPVFPDVADALHTLKRQFKLAIVSNVDDDLFVGTARHLGVEFDAVVTSQQARSYKPNLGQLHPGPGAHGRSARELAARCGEPAPRRWPGERARHNVGVGESRGPWRGHPPERRQTRSGCARPC